MSADTVDVCNDSNKVLYVGVKSGVLGIKVSNSKLPEVPPLDDGIKNGLTMSPYFTQGRPLQYTDM